MNTNRTTHMVLSTVNLLANIVCILLVLTLLSNTLGILSLSFLHLSSIYLIIAVILLNLPLRQTILTLKITNPHLKKQLIGLLLLLTGLLLLIFSSTQLLWISSIPILICGLDILLRSLDKKRKELPVLAAASFGYTIVFLLLQTIPVFWNLLHQCSLLVSSGIGALTNTPLLLGPTTSGLWILLIFLSFFFSSFFLLRKKTRKETTWFIACLIELFLVWILYLIVLSILSFPTKNQTVQYHPVFFALCLIPTFFYLLRYRFTETTSEVLPQNIRLKRLLKNGAVWAAVFLFLSSGILTIFINTATPEENRTVVFYADHMLGTWDVPEYGKYGKDGVGMFGLWPVYLTRLGYKTELLVHNRTLFLNTTQPPTQNITRYLNLTDYVSLIETPTITQDLLNDVQIFVVTNLNTSLSPEEHEVIWEFVNNGGSLLVIGDHTNVGGMQTPLNQLLRPVGISYRFDATLPLDETFKWLTCTQVLHHPITAPLTSRDELQWGVGASLDIASASFPVVIGSYALSDQGNQSNNDIAYLGDYEYNKGEQLGDVILVAAAYYGQGKVLVFGDTSCFQNTAVPFSYSLLHSTFTWLASTQTQTSYGLQLGIALLLLIGAILVYRLSKNKTLPFVVFPVVLCVALLLSTSVNPLVTDKIAMTGNIVCIDASHNERFSLDPFTDESVNGLLLNLQRNNYQPVVLRAFAKDTITASKMFICIAPTTGFTGEELSVLKEYMTNGGIILLATGYDDKEASLPLLQTVAADITQVPLGPVPYVESNTTLYQNEPRFVDSWPIQIPQNQTISYYNFTWGDTTYHLVVFIHYGTGGLLLISDSQYLLDKNIESIYDYWPGNILFLKYLFNEVQHQEEHR